MLLAAVFNLLQNAFKYTHPHTEVTVSCRTSANRILIDVADHCGGIGPELTIARRFVVENGGRLSVRDLPYIGCVLTASLPRHVKSN